MVAGQPRARRSGVAVVDRDPPETGCLQPVDRGEPTEHRPGRGGGRFVERLACGRWPRSPIRVPVSQTVWKFPLPVINNIELWMPLGAEILHVAEQDGQVCLWALVER